MNAFICDLGRYLLYYARKVYFIATIPYLSNVIALKKFFISIDSKIKIVKNRNHNMYVIHSSRLRPTIQKLNKNTSRYGKNKKDHWDVRARWSRTAARWLDGGRGEGRGAPPPLRLPPPPQRLTRTHHGTYASRLPLTPWR